MTLKTTIASDLGNVFFNTDDFAEAFVFSRSGLTVNGIFDNDFAVIVDSVETTRPVLQLQDSDITGIRHGDTFTRVTTSVVYNVVGNEPDGTGATLVILSED